MIRCIIMKNTNISIEQRLRSLETEQVKQNTDLGYLHSFAEEVKAFEQQLHQLYEQPLLVAAESSYAHDEEDTLRMEAELARMKGYHSLNAFEESYFEEIAALKEELSTERPQASQKDVFFMDVEEQEVIQLVLDEEEEDSSDCQHAPVQHGYIIRLMFNSEHPSEWSSDAGGGWRDTGQGQCFSTKRQAQEIFTKLKKQWPNYPLKVIHR